MSDLSVTNTHIHIRILLYDTHLRSPVIAASIAMKLSISRVPQLFVCIDNHFVHQIASAHYIKCDRNLFEFYVRISLVNDMILICDYIECDVELLKKQNCFNV